MEPIVFRELWMERCQQVQALPERDDRARVARVGVVFVGRDGRLARGEERGRDAGDDLDGRVCW